MENKEFIIITGATGGLGRAYTKKCAKLGYNLLLTSTTQSRLDSLKEEILKEFNIDVITKACNLADFDSIEEFLKFIDNKNLNISLLINNAGYITEGSFENSDTSTLTTCIKVNCEGVTHLTKGILDRFATTKKLKILTVTSMAGEYSMPYMAIYSATKAMLNNLLNSLRIEYKKHNVKFLIVEPGAIETTTEMKEAVKSQGIKGKLSSVSPEIIAHKSLKKLNKKRYIPGMFNKLTIFFSCFLTKTAKSKIAGKMWKKSQEKRNIK